MSKYEPVADEISFHIDSAPSSIESVGKNFQPSSYEFGIFSL